MKGREIPQGVLIGVIALAVIIVGAIAFSMFGGGGSAPVDPANVSADRLRDPDPPRVGQQAQGGDPNKRQAN